MVGKEQVREGRAVGGGLEGFQEVRVIGLQMLLGELGRFKDQKEGNGERSVGELRKECRDPSRDSGVG